MIQFVSTCLLLLVLSIQGIGQNRQNTFKRAAKGLNIYVSPDGDDGNDGSIGSPFKTIYKAGRIVKPGTTIYLREGVYAEKVSIPSGTFDSPVVVQAYENEKVTITGVDTIGNWQNYRDNIYYTVVNNKVSQLFASEKQMVYARWPNLNSDDLFQQNYAIADQVDYNKKGATSVIDDSEFSTLQGIDIVGAKVWLPYPLVTAWNSLTETVTSQSSGGIRFTSSYGFEENKDNIKYFLSGKLSLLDAEEEWFYDENSNRLYFIAPDGVDPSTLTVLARTRLDGIVVNGSNVQLKGLEFFASRATLKGNHNLIEECNFYYPRPFYHTERWKEQPGVSITGNFNTIRKCESAWSWGSGISVRRGADNIVEECLVHDCNWSGSIAPGIWIDGRRIIARNNTVYGCGRSGIRHYHIYNSLVEKNHVYDYGKINTDLGGIKGGLQNYEHSIWRYNFTHAQVTNKAKAGIYLDASNDNAVVHHNVCFNVHLSINGEVNNDSVFNNTLVATNPKQKIWSHFQRHPDWDYRSVYVWNNLTTKDVKGTDLKNNLKVPAIDDMNFAGYEYGDFRLTETSQAIDKGIEIPNITNEIEGNSPDAGAYEFGAEGEAGNWFPGITWSPEWNQLPHCNISVVQDSENPLNYTFLATDATDPDGWIMRYDWDFGDATQSYGKSVEHTFSPGVTYQVKLTLRDNLGGVKIIIKNLSQETSAIDSNKVEPGIYPNPVSSSVTVELPTPVNYVKIVDNSGVVVKDIPDVGAGRNNINLMGLADGIYFLLICSGSSLLTKKIIKTN